MAYIPPNLNGQATSANSAPVVIASDQSAVPSQDINSNMNRVLLEQILVELKVLNFNLCNGLNIKDDTDDLRIEKHFSVN